MNMIMLIHKSICEIIDLTTQIRSLMLNPQIFYNMKVSPLLRVRDFIHDLSDAEKSICGFYSLYCLLSKECLVLLSKK